MRDCTRALIIKHADKLGTTHITLEVANEGIEQAKEYMEEAMKTGNLKDMIANLTGTEQMTGARPIKDMKLSIHDTFNPVSSSSRSAGVPSSNSSRSSSRPVRRASGRTTAGPSTTSSPISSR